LTRAAVYQGKARLYEKTNKLENVLEQYDLLLSVYQVIKDLQWESNTLFDKAVLLKKMGRKDEAVDSFEKSIKSLETFRQQTAFPELKKTFFQRYYRRYEEVALYMLENNYYEKGYQCVEDMKARLFRDRLSEDKTELEKGIDKELKSERNGLILKLSDFAKRMFEASQKNPKELEKLEKDYRQMEKDFDDLLIKIRVKSPQYASVQFPEPVTVTTLQKDLLKEGELLLHYFVTAEKVYVFLISKEDFQVVTLDVTENFINTNINRYSFNAKKRYKKEMSEYMTKIYQSIFKPLEPKMKGKKEIIVIPDGELAKVPFEAFVVGGDTTLHPVYLLEKYRIKYFQGASVLENLRKPGKMEIKTNSFIGFGDPVYDYENFKQGKEEYEEEGSNKDENVFWKRLPGSGDEVKVIDVLFRKLNQKSQFYLREEATEKNAKSPYLKDFAYIHFSCHGVLGEVYQGLVLSQIPGSPGNNANEDGYLTLEEIMNCDYDAKLVVLSACETGLGKLEKGEGVTGLTRAVMYAGTPAVIVSLWNVDVDGTKELLIRFYRDMLEKGMEKEEALRQAKLEMIKGGNHSSPYFWSSFVMYGE
jgi:CHAT domain-containing protein